MWISEEELADLADAGAWQLVDQGDVTRSLRFAEPLVAPFDQLFDRWGSSRVGGDNIGDRHLVAYCVGHTDDPILEFDQSGKLLKSFGSELFVYPHGIFIDKEDNIWTTDGQGNDSSAEKWSTPASAPLVSSRTPVWNTASRALSSRRGNRRL